MMPESRLAAFDAAARPTPSAPARMSADGQTRLRQPCSTGGAASINSTPLPPARQASLQDLEPGTRHGGFLRRARRGSDQSASPVRSAAAVRSMNPPARKAATSTFCSGSVDLAGDEAECAIGCHRLPASQQRRCQRGEIGPGGNKWRQAQSSRPPARVAPARWRSGCRHVRCASRLICKLSASTSRCRSRIAIMSRRMASSASGVSLT